MKHSVSSLVLLVVLVVLSILVELTHARLGDEINFESEATTDTTAAHHDTSDLVTMNDDLPELQDASIAGSDRDLQKRSSRSFSNPNRDELLAAFNVNVGNDSDVDNGDDNFVRVMVGYKNDAGRHSARGFADGSHGRGGAQKWREMKNLRVATMTIAKSSLEALRRNPNIE
jgi:hypothetical protein